MAERLETRGPKLRLTWPGLGCEPPDPGVTGLDSLVALVLGHLDGPANLVAQSMGGVVALQAALAAPHRVRRLVLAVTSGGVAAPDIAREDWRPAYFETFPNAARWIAEPAEDLTHRLVEVHAPALLLWGDADPLCPLALGRRLAELLPSGRLHVVPGGDHDLAHIHAATLAPVIDAFLAD